MAPGDNTGRQFSEDVERLVRGQLPESTDEDYTATLEFARRLVDLKDDPSPAFTSSLREELMLKLAQQDVQSAAQEQPSLLVRLFGGRTVRLAVVSTFIVVAALGLVWRAGLLSPMMPAGSDEAPSLMQDGAAQDSEEAAPEEGDGEAPEMIRATDKMDEDAGAASTPPSATPVVIRAEAATAVVHGESVAISLFFENSGPEEMTLTPFPPAVILRDMNTDASVYVFPSGTSSLALSSMESMQYDVIWEQTDQASTQAPAGVYAVDVGPTTATAEGGDNGAAALEALEVAVIEVLSE